LEICNKTKINYRESNSPELSLKFINLSLNQVLKTPLPCLLKAYLLYEQNNFQESLIYFEKYYSMIINKSSSEQVSKALNMMGCCSSKLGKFQIAIQHFKKAIELNTEDLNPIFNVGVQYYLMDMWESYIQMVIFFFFFSIMENKLII